MSLTPMLFLYVYLCYCLLCDVNNIKRFSIHLFLNLTIIVELSAIEDNSTVDSNVYMKSNLL